VLHDVPCRCCVCAYDILCNVRARIQPSVCVCVYLTQHLSQNFFKASRFSSRNFSAYSRLTSRPSHRNPRVSPRVMPRAYSHVSVIGSVIGSVIVPRTFPRVLGRARCRDCVILTHHKYIHIKYRIIQAYILSYHFIYDTL